MYIIGVIFFTRLNTLLFNISGSPFRNFLLFWKQTISSRRKILTTKKEEERFFSFVFFERFFSFIFFERFWKQAEEGLLVSRTALLLKNRSSWRTACFKNRSSSAASKNSKKRKEQHHFFSSFVVLLVLLLLEVFFCSEKKKKNHFLFFEFCQFFRIDPFFQQVFILLFFEEFKEKQTKFSKFLKKRRPGFVHLFRASRNTKVLFCCSAVLLFCCSAVLLFCCFLLLLFFEEFKWFVAACFKNRSSSEEPLKENKVLVLFICFKNGLFQEQEEKKWCCSFLLLLVSRIACFKNSKKWCSSVLFFFCLFQEPLVSTNNVVFLNNTWFFRTTPGWRKQHLFFLLKQNLLFPNNTLLKKTTPGLLLLLVLLLVKQNLVFLNRRTPC